MNILHVSTSANFGGAARAAHRLHTGLRRLGHDSFVLVNERASSDPTVIPFLPPRGVRGRLLRLLRQERINRSFAPYRASLPDAYELFSDDRVAHGSALLSQMPCCDVVNLHWIAGFVDYRSFFPEVPKRSPTVWTLHDMNPFTGGCHYDDGCGKFVDGCGSCPQLGCNDPSDLSRQIWRRKRQVLHQVEPRRFHIVTPSRWLAAEAERSSLLGRFPISVIPNALDTDAFSPRDCTVARAALEVPQDAGVVLFVADSAVNKRKGFSLLAEALAGPNGLPNLFLICVGGGDPIIDHSIPHLCLGHVSNDRLLSLVYAAADVFVIPSIQDNLPNGVLESLACGTPVVGFSVGGIPDMVRAGATGLLAPPQDTAALSAAITRILENPTERERMSVNCRRIAVQEYALERQAERYVALYHQMLACNQSHSEGAPRALVD